MKIADVGKQGGRRRRRIRRAIEYRVASTLQLSVVERVDDALQIAARLGQRIGETEPAQFDAIRITDQCRLQRALVVAYRTTDGLAQIAFEFRHRARDRGETVL